MLSRILSRGGTFASPLWKASQVDVPEVNAKPMSPQGPSVPISQSNYGTPPNYSASPKPAAKFDPNDAFLRGNESSPLDVMNWPYGPYGKPSNPPSPVVSRDAVVPTPTPQPRPTEAPQAEPDLSFWQRNAALMRDPGTGAFIDPTGAAKAVRGPDLINKMMAYLHDKEIG